MVRVRRALMRRWSWPIIIVTTFGAGVVAGMTRPPRTATQHEMVDLQRHIGTLQDERRVRDATVAALQQQLQATSAMAATAVIASTTPIAITPPTPAARTEPAPHQAEPPS